MDRRAFIKSGIGSMAGLGLGERVLLHPSSANALSYRALPDGAKRKVKNDYRRATRVASVGPTGAMPSADKAQVALGDSVVAR